MIIQSDIEFHSLCEHHMLPFYGTAAVAYIPNGRIVGLSKLARCVDAFSRRLQNQERITKQVADALQTALNPSGVAVVLRARHMCMEMRGIKKRGAVTTTSCLMGDFLQAAPRAEFLSLVNNLRA
jgi:GTP cyclohydrolase I